MAPPRIATSHSLRAPRPLFAVLVALAALTGVPASPAGAQVRIFGDGFDCGFTFGWSATVPAPPPRLELTSPPANLADVSTLVAMATGIVRRQAEPTVAAARAPG